MRKEGNKSLEAFLGIRNDRMKRAAITLLRRWRQARQRRACRARSLERLLHAVGDIGRMIAELIKAEGSGQPLGGIDRDDERLSAEERGSQSHRRTQGGLAYSARSARDDHFAGGQDLVEVFGD